MIDVNLVSHFWVSRWLSGYYLWFGVLRDIFTRRIEYFKWFPSHAPWP
jgi:hypothetical protein